MYAKPDPPALDEQGCLEIASLLYSRPSTWSRERP
jgi:hypothetical protein